MNMPGYNRNFNNPMGGFNNPMVGGGFQGNQMGMPNYGFAGRGGMMGGNMRGGPGGMRGRGGGMTPAPNMMGMPGMGPMGGMGMNPMAGGMNPMMGGMAGNMGMQGTIPRAHPISDQISNRPSVRNGWLPRPEPGLQPRLLPPEPRRRRWLMEPAWHETQSPGVNGDLHCALPYLLHLQACLGGIATLASSRRVILLPLLFL